MKRNRKFLFAISLWLTGTVAGAQVQEIAMPFLEADQSSVTSGLAGASVLRGYDCSDISASYGSWSESSTRYYDISGNIVAGHKLLIRANGLYGKGDWYEICNGLSVSSTRFAPSDIVVGASAMYRILPVFSVEAGVRYVSMKLSPESTVNAFAGDVLLRGYLSGFSVAAGVTNLGSKVCGFSLPSAVVLALAYDNGASSDHRFRPEVDAKYYFPGVFGLSAGVDYTFRDMLSLRAGYHYGGVVADYASVGLGFKFAGFHIDASYLVKTAFCIGLGYSF